MIDGTQNQKKKKHKDKKIKHEKRYAKYEGTKKKKENNENHENHEKSAAKEIQKERHEYTRWQNTRVIHFFCFFFLSRSSKKTICHSEYFK